MRKAAGKVWRDDSLAEWPENDFRLFLGDLGGDTTDEMLHGTFARYPSFAKAKVVRDKRTKKSRGFGFASFLDPHDASAAMRELNGKYLGSRPIKISKSRWKERDLAIVAAAEKEHREAMRLKLGGRR